MLPPPARTSRARPGTAWAITGIVIDRPVLYGAAGSACAPLVVFSIVAFPMVIPCVLLFIAFAKAQTEARSPSFLAGCILAGFLVPIFGALWKLVTDTAQFTYTFAGGSESGDYFTPRNAALCIAIIVADIALAAALAWISPARDNAWR